MAENSDTAAKKRRGAGKPFQPGQSGNPGGRPKVLEEIKNLAREHSETAIKTLADIAKDAKANHSARVAAANALLDRGYGKPLQTIEASVSLLDQMTADEQTALAAALEALARNEDEPASGVATTH